MDSLPLDQLYARFLNHHRARNHAQNTIDHYQESFRDFDRFLAATERSVELATLSTATMEAFAQWLKITPTRVWRGKTERSIQGLHGRLKDLRAFCSWLWREELIPRPINVPMPKLPQTLFPILSEEELARVFSCHHLTAPGPQGVRNRALFGFMLDTGVRVSEVAGLTLDALDLANGLATIHGKGSKERKVPFASGVEGLLRAWLAVRGEEPGALFWLTANGIQVLFQRVSRDAGVAVSPHMLRHQAATHMVNANADLHTVRRILGHSHLSVTEKYLSLSFDDLKRKHAAASPFELVRTQLAPIVPPKRKRLSLG